MGGHTLRFGSTGKVHAKVVQNLVVGQLCPCPATSNQGSRLLQPCLLNCCAEALSALFAAAHCDSESSLGFLVLCRPHLPSVPLLVPSLSRIFAASMSVLHIPWALTKLKYQDRRLSTSACHWMSCYVFMVHNH